MQPCLKICGVTDIAQANALHALGVDYIGLIFHAPSPRSINLAQADQFASLSNTIVPVIVSQTADEVEDILQRTQAKHIQLHGGPVAVPTGIHKIIAISFKQPSRPSLNDLQSQYGFDAKKDSLLFDSIHLTDIDSITAIIERYQPCRFFIAGRITPEQIVGLVKRLKPDGIDMASTVESAPGIKDLELVKQALEECRQCHSN